MSGPAAAARSGGAGVAAGVTRRAAAGADAGGGGGCGWRGRMRVAAGGCGVAGAWMRYEYGCRVAGCGTCWSFMFTPASSPHRWRSSWPRRRSTRTPRWASRASPRFDVIQSGRSAHSCWSRSTAHPEAPAAHKETAHYLRWRDAVAELMAEPRSSARYVNVFPGDAQGWSSVAPTPEFELAAPTRICSAQDARRDGGRAGRARVRAAGLTGQSPAGPRGAGGAAAAGCGRRPSPSPGSPPWRARAGWRPRAPPPARS